MATLATVSNASLCRQAEFRRWPINIDAYLSRPDFVPSIMADPVKCETALQALRDDLQNVPRSLEGCVAWARLKFEASSSDPSA